MPKTLISTKLRDRVAKELLESFKDLKAFARAKPSAFDFKVL